MNTHQKGYVGEQVVKLKLVAGGWNVAKPEVEDRYDLIADDGQNLWRVQVKYVDDYMGDALTVDLRKQCRSNGVTKVYTRKEIDALVLYVPKTDKIYWVPVDVFDGMTTLNFQLVSGRQKKRTRMLSDFEWVGSSVGRARLS